MILNIGLLVNLSMRTEYLVLKGSPFRPENGEIPKIL